MGKRRIFAMLMLLFAVPALLGLFAFALPPLYAETYLAALPDKAAALKAADSPKVVLVGGSGTAFDTDCALLKEETGLESVNLGLYAGLGTTVMLEMALPDIASGDIVVFSPELNPQTLSDHFDPSFLWQACETDLGLLFRLDPSRLEGMVSAFPLYAARKARAFLLGEGIEPEGVYSRAAFTLAGDVKADLRPGNVMPGGVDVNTPLSFEGLAPTEAFLDRVNTFARACAARGARVYFRFCPMNAQAFIPGEAEEAGEDFTRTLERALVCPVLGSAERARMDSVWFYDTNFHLNGAGARYNTLLLAEEIKQVLGDQTPLKASFQAPPDAPWTDTARGESREAALFTYAKQGDQAVLTGLTPAGQERETLILPARVGDWDVVALDRSVFAGNERVREITLPEGLRSIPDGAFEGCRNLKALYLPLRDPAACTVGQGLLRGTDALVYVPAESFGRYCTNYFWAVHASRLIPMEFPDDTPQASGAPAAVPTQAEAARTITRLTYEGSGGTLRNQEGDTLTRMRTYAHARENTLQGSVWFRREGYVLTGWNTRADGSGVTVGLGSRYGFEDGDTLFAQWAPATEEALFDYELASDGAQVTGYRGGETCVIPETLGGRPVTVIRSGAFREKELSYLVFPPSLRALEEGAFSACVLQEAVLFDSLRKISDASFAACVLPQTLRVNAATRPVYSGSYFDAFQDKYDRLLALRDHRKLVLSSGSSGRYGYVSPMLEEAFPDYAVINMGVYAYTSALPQLRLMLPLLQEGDVLLYAPEFDAAPEQFCETDRLDTGFWAMMESGYDAAATLDMRQFSGVFDSLGAYLQARARMPGLDYSFSPARFDDDGNSYLIDTYNEYGDFILPRPDGDSDGRLRDNIADYTVGNITPRRIACLNRALAPFVQQGVRVLFAYTPRNSASLTKESTPENRGKLEEQLQALIEVPVVSRLEDSLFPGRLFWLIDSHLSTNGARLRTERIIEDLKKNGL